MKKKIFKVIGIVLASVFGFTGAVVGVLALMGKFKTPVVYPDTLVFENEEMVIVDNYKEDDFYSFKLLGTDSTQSEHPVNRTTCYLEFVGNQGANLIELYNSKKEKIEKEFNKFRIDCNSTTYFKLVKNNEVLSKDGKVVLRARSEGDTAISATTLTIWIDRKINTIGVNDDSTPEYVGNQWKQSFVIGTDVKKYISYIANPENSLTPISKANSEKVVELYFHNRGVEDDYVLVTQESVVENEDLSKIIKYDEEKKQFYFYSNVAKNYEFKIAVFPTLEQRINFLADEANLELTNTERLQHMLVTSLNVQVVDSDIDEIRLENSGVVVDLYQNNVYVTLNGEVTVTGAKQNNLNLTMYKEGYKLEESRYDSAMFGKLEDFVEITNSVNFISERDELAPIDAECVVSQIAIDVEVEGETKTAYIVRYLIKDTTKFYCKNGLALAYEKTPDSYAICGILRPGVYLDFYKYDADTEIHSLYAEAPFEISEINGSYNEKKSWKVVSTNTISGIVNLGVLIVNANGQFLESNLFKTTSVSVAPVELDYQIQPDIYDLNISYNSDGEVNYGSELFSDIVKNVTGSYNAVVFAVDNDETGINTSIGKTIEIDGKTYKIVGNAIDNFDVELTENAKNKPIKLHLIQLKNKYNENASATLTGSYEAVKIVEDIVAINPKFNINPTLIDKGGVDEFGGYEIFYNDQENLTTTIGIKLGKSSEMLLHLLDFYAVEGETPDYNALMHLLNDGVRYNGDIANNIEITKIEKDETNKAINLTFKTKSCANNQNTAFKIILTNVELAEIKIKSSSPSSIAYKDVTAGKTIELFSTDNAAQDSTTKWLEVEIGANMSDDPTLKLVDNGVEISDITLNAETIENNNGFQDNEGYKVKHSITYESNNSDIFSVSGTTLTANHIGEAILAVRFGNVTNYIKVKVIQDGNYNFAYDTDGGGDSFDVVGNKIENSEFNSVTGVNPNKKFINVVTSNSEIELNSLLKLSYSTDTKNLIVSNYTKIKNIREIDYTVSELQVTPVTDGWALDNGDEDDTDDVFTITKDAHNKWNIKRITNNVHVPISFTFDVQTKLGTVTINLTISSNIQTTFNNAFWKETTIFADTTIEFIEVKSSISEVFANEPFIGIKGVDPKGVTFELSGKEGTEKEGTDWRTIGTTQVKFKKSGTYNVKVKNGSDIIMELTGIKVVPNYVVMAKSDPESLTTDTTENNISGVFDTVKSFVTSGVVYGYNLEADPTQPKNCKSYYNSGVLAPTEEVTVYSNFKVVALNEDGSVNNLISSTKTTFSIGWLNDINVNKTIALTLLDSFDNAITYGTQEVVIKNKYGLNFGSKTEINLMSLKEYAVSNLFNVTDADMELTTVTCGGDPIYDTTTGKLTIPVVTSDTEDAEFIFTFTKSGKTLTYTTTAGSVPFNILRWEPVGESSPTAIASKEFDLLEDVFNEGTIVDEIKSITLTSVKINGAERTDLANIFNNVSGVLNLYTKDTTIDYHYSFKDSVLNTNSINVTLVYTIIDTDSNSWTIEKEIDLNNRQKLTLTYPEQGDSKKISGVEVANRTNSADVFTLDDQMFEPVLINPSSTTMLTLAQKDGKLVIRAKADNQITDDTISTTLKINNIYYQTGLHNFNEYCARIGVNGLEISLPTATNGTQGYLVFEIASVSGNVGYYCIYVYSSSDTSINPTTNIDVSIDSDTTDLTTEAIVKKALGKDPTYTLSNSDTVLGKAYQAEFFEFYVVSRTELVDGGWDEETLTYEKITSLNSLNISVNKYTTIVISVVYNNKALEHYGIGTITFYVQPTDYESIDTSNTQINPTLSVGNSASISGNPASATIAGKIATFTYTGTPEELTKITFNGSDYLKDENNFYAEKKTDYFKLNGSSIEYYPREISIRNNKGYEISNGEYVATINANTTEVACPFGTGYTILSYNNGENASIQINKKADGTFVLARVQADTTFDVYYTKGSLVVKVTYKYLATTIPVGGEFTGIGDFNTSTKQFKNSFIIDSRIMGSYTGAYVISAITGANDANVAHDDATKTLTFTQTHEYQTFYLTFIYTDFGNETRTFKFVVEPGFYAEENSAIDEHGLSQVKRKSTTIKASDLYSSPVGSTLTFTKVEKGESYDHDNDPATPQVTNTELFYEIGGYKVYVSDEDAKLQITFGDHWNYVLNSASTAVLSNTDKVEIAANNGVISFVHLATATNATMTVSLVDDSGNKQFDECTMYITIAQTYKGIESVYVTKDATRENVNSATGLIIDYLYENLFKTKLYDTDATPSVNPIKDLNKTYTLNLVFDDDILTTVTFNNVNYNVETPSDGDYTLIASGFKSDYFVYNADDTTLKYYNYETENTLGTECTITRTAGENHGTATLTFADGTIISNKYRIALKSINDELYVANGIFDTMGFNMANNPNKPKFALTDGTGAGLISDGTGIQFDVVKDISNITLNVSNSAGASCNYIYQSLPKAEGVDYSTTSGKYVEADKYISYNNYYDGNEISDISKRRELVVGDLHDSNPPLENMYLTSITHQSGDDMVVTAIVRSLTYNGTTNALESVDYFITTTGASAENLLQLTLKYYTDSNTGITYRRLYAKLLKDGEPKEKEAFKITIFGSTTKIVTDLQLVFIKGSVVSQHPSTNKDESVYAGDSFNVLGNKITTDISGAMLKLNENLTKYTLGKTEYTAVERKGGAGQYILFDYNETTSWLSINGIGEKIVNLELVFDAYTSDNIYIQEVKYYVVIQRNLQVVVNDATLEAQAGNDEALTTFKLDSTKIFKENDESAQKYSFITKQKAIATYPLERSNPYKTGSEGQYTYNKLLLNVYKLKDSNYANPTEENLMLGYNNITSITCEGAYSDYIKITNTGTDINIEFLKDLNTGTEGIIIKIGIETANGTYTFEWKIIVVGVVSLDLKTEKPNVGGVFKSGVEVKTFNLSEDDSTASTAVVMNKNTNNGVSITVTATAKYIESNTSIQTMNNRTIFNLGEDYFKNEGTLKYYLNADDNSGVECAIDKTANTATFTVNNTLQECEIDFANANKTQINKIIYNNIDYVFETNKFIADIEKPIVTIPVLSGLSGTITGNSILANTTDSKIAFILPNVPLSQTTSPVIYVVVYEVALKYNEYETDKFYIAYNVQNTADISINGSASVNLDDRLVDGKGKHDEKTPGNNTYLELFTYDALTTPTTQSSTYSLFKSGFTSGEDYNNFISDIAYVSIKSNTSTYYFAFEELVTDKTYGINLNARYKNSNLSETLAVEPFVTNELWAEFKIVSKSGVELITLPAFSETNETGFKLYSNNTLSAVSTNPISVGTIFGNVEIVDDNTGDGLDIAKIRQLTVLGVVDDTANISTDWVNNTPSINSIIQIATIKVPTGDGSNTVYELYKVTYDGATGTLYKISKDFYVVKSTTGTIINTNYSQGQSSQHFFVGYTDGSDYQTLGISAVKKYEMSGNMLIYSTPSSGVTIERMSGNLAEENAIKISSDNLQMYKNIYPTITQYVAKYKVTYSEVSVVAEVRFSLPEKQAVSVNQNATINIGNIAISYIVYNKNVYKLTSDFEFRATGVDNYFAYSGTQLKYYVSDGADGVDVTITNGEATFSGETAIVIYNTFVKAGTNEVVSDIYYGTNLYVYDATTKQFKATGVDKFAYSGTKLYYYKNAADTTGAEVNADGEFMPGGMAQQTATLIYSNKQLIKSVEIAAGYINYIKNSSNETTEYYDKANSTLTLQEDKVDKYFTDNPSADKLVIPFTIVLTDNSTISFNVVIKK